MMTLRMVVFLFGFTDGWIVSNGHVRLLLFERLGRLDRWLILALMITLCLFLISLFSAWSGSAKNQNQMISTAAIWLGVLMHGNHTWWSQFWSLNFYDNSKPAFLHCFQWRQHIFWAMAIPKVCEGKRFYYFEERTMRCLPWAFVCFPRWFCLTVCLI